WPRPAARFIARIVALPASEGVAGGTRRAAGSAVAGTLLDVLHQPRKRVELAIAARGPQRVAEHARHVGDIAVLAVAVTQTGKDAEHLQVALQPHPLEVPVERGEVSGDRQAVRSEER